MLKPKKPSKPIEPRPPQTHTLSRDSATINVNSVEVSTDYSYYDGDPTLESLKINGSDFESIYNLLVRVSKEHNVSLQNITIHYDAYGSVSVEFDAMKPNPRYDKEMAKYQRDFAAYEKKRMTYEALSAQYEKDLAQYEAEKLERDYKKAQETLTALEKKIAKRKKQ